MLKTPPEVMAATIEYTRIRSIALPAAYLTDAAYAVLVAQQGHDEPAGVRVRRRGGERVAGLDRRRGHG